MVKNRNVTKISQNTCVGVTFALNSKIKSVFQNDTIFTMILDKNAFSFKWMKSVSNCLVTSVRAFSWTPVFLLHRHLI